MHERVRAALEEIDAAVSSGDTFPSEPKLREQAEDRDIAYRYFQKWEEILRPRSLPGGMMPQKDAANLITIAVRAAKQKSLDDFTVWLLKKHGLLIDESLLLPPDGAPSSDLHSTGTSPGPTLEPSDPRFGGRETAVFGASDYMRSPTVHVGLILENRTLCGLTPGVSPGWVEGDRWVREGHEINPQASTEISCKGCFDALVARGRHESDGTELTGLPVLLRGNPGQAFVRPRGKERVMRAPREGERHGIGPESPAHAEAVRLPTHGEARWPGRTVPRDPEQP